MLDWAKRADTVYTPQREFADLTALKALPKAKLTVTKTLHPGGSSHQMTVSVVNHGAGIAFLVNLRLTRGKSGDTLVPVFWSDNYFSLLPGEKKSVTVQFESSSLAGAVPELLVDGWNVEPASL